MYSWLPVGDSGRSFDVLVIASRRLGEALNGVTVQHWVEPYDFRLMDRIDKC